MNKAGKSFWISIKCLRKPSVREKEYKMVFQFLSRWKFEKKFIQVQNWKCIDIFFLNFTFFLGFGVPTSHSTIWNNISSSKSIFVPYYSLARATKLYIIRYHIFMNLQRVPLKNYLSNKYFVFSLRTMVLQFLSYKFFFVLCSSICKTE